LMIGKRHGRVASPSWSIGHSPRTNFEASFDSGNNQDQNQQRIGDRGMEAAVDKTDDGRYIAVHRFLPIS
jgi:hypothetical protein